MSQQERPIIDRVWEFTKDISVKVSKQAEKHWKINTLRVEIASIKHKKNNCCKELGKFVYESLKSNTVEEESYKTSLEGFFVELKNLDGEIEERENRIEVLAVEPVQDEDEQDDPGGTPETEDVIEAEVEPTQDTKAEEPEPGDDQPSTATDKEKEGSDS